MVPSGSKRLLERKKARLSVRLDSLKAQAVAAEREMAEIDAALAALSSPMNGRAAKKLPIFKGIKFSQKDWVLAEVKRRPKAGITRVEIAERVAQTKGVVLSPNTVTTYLHRLSRDGMVRHDGGVWRAM